MWLDNCGDWIEIGSNNLYQKCGRLKRKSLKIEISIDAVESWSQGMKKRYFLTEVNSKNLIYEPPKSHSKEFFKCSVDLEMVECHFVQRLLPLPFWDKLVTKH